MKLRLEKKKKLKSVFCQPVFVIPCVPCLEYPIENLIRGRLYPCHMTVPRFKCILFGFHKISRFIAKVTFASIPGNIEDRRMQIFLDLVDNLQTRKTTISFFGHRLQGGFAAFHSFIWQF